MNIEDILCAQCLAKYNKITQKRSVADDITDIIDHLNKSLGLIRGYKASAKSTQSKIMTLFREGYTPEEIKLVITHRVSEWYTDAKMRKFLRPETLFRASKFEDYLVQASNDTQEGSLTPLEKGHMSSVLDSLKGN